MMKTIFAILAASVSCIAPAAGQTAHNSLASFQAALPMGSAETTLNFDSLTAGDSISSMGTVTGFQFIYDFDDGAGLVQMQVNDTGDASSGSNTLGTNDAGIFQDGDDFAVMLPVSVGFGIEIISKDVLLDDDIMLSFNGGTVSLDVDIVEQVLSDGNVFFLGVTGGNAGDTAIITTQGAGEFLFNIDCVVRGLVLGDMSGDGELNLLDVDPFVSALVANDLSNPAADVNQDGFLNLFDVFAFIELFG